MSIRVDLAHCLIAVGALMLAQSALAFYNPSTGRWLSRDPIAEEDSANVYVFAGILRSVIHRLGR
jgi:hypothetical protein